MRIKSVNVGRPRLVVHNGRQHSTAIGREPQDGAVQAGELGLAGDRVGNPSVHGGIDQALCVYPAERYPDVATFLGVGELPTPSFGENLTTEGLVETEVCIGDRFRAGDSVVEVTKPRQPCATLARRLGNPGVIEWIYKTGFSGWYLRVIEPGGVAAGQAIELLERPWPELTIARTLGAMADRNAPADLLEALAACDRLAADWREQFGARLGRRAEA